MRDEVEEDPPDPSAAWLDDTAEVSGLKTKEELNFLTLTIATIL